MERAIAVAQRAGRAVAARPSRRPRSRSAKPVTERMAQSGEATDKAVTEIWTAPETLARIRDYVARTLKKA